VGPCDPSPLLSEHLKSLNTSFDLCLFGWVLWRIVPERHSFSVSKLAVADDIRGAGYGKLLVEWCKSKAQSVPGLTSVALVSLPDRVQFYQKMGFKKMFKMDDPVYLAALGQDKEVNKMFFFFFSVKGSR
jgi:N-acetylglutamate synthase-like GNAT family acetyltransferase